MPPVRGTCTPGSTTCRVPCRKSLSTAPPPISACSSLSKSLLRRTWTPSRTFIRPQTRMPMYCSVQTSSPTWRSFPVSVWTRSPAALSWSSEPSNTSEPPEQKTRGDARSHRQKRWLFCWHCLSPASAKEADTKKPLRQWPQRLKHAARLEASARQVALNHHKVVVAECRARHTTRQGGELLSL